MGSKMALSATTADIKSANTATPAQWRTIGRVKGPDKTNGNVGFGFG